MNYKKYQKELEEAIQETVPHNGVAEANDIPQADKVYKLTGGPGEKCIANGNTWAESEVGVEVKNDE